MKLESRFVHVPTVFLLVLSLLFISGCVTAKQKRLESGLKSLGNTELESLFSKEFKAKFLSYKYDTTSYLHYFPDGVQKIETPKFDDKGVYQLVNGEHCSQWEIIRQGAEKCTTWFKIEDNKYEVFNPDGSKNGTVTIL